MGDFIPKKKLLFAGMLMQAITLLALSTAAAFWFFIALSVLLGLGKATVYPIFSASIAENAHPRQRAQSIGTFRFWRDGVYAVGAIVAGILADAFSIAFAMIFVGCITMLSAIVLHFRMQATPNVEPRRRL